ncbi:MTHFD2 [Mytilus edulis]|uniref:methenyltetrahydrofolate cyclohydrolase n=1 Tax=Mytilus edulis TaxID=6550 RepID=A0A8S3RY07_MYTED|nr:MTHFD2 [Mytilus edulis]
MTTKKKYSCNILWMHNISRDANIQLLYTGRETHSKPKRMWKDKPEHWPLNKPFYDPKNKSQDEHGKSISNEDLLKSLLDCCKHKNVQINFLYQKEVDAWREQKHELLNKLYIFRRNTEKIKLAIQNMLFCKDFGEIRAALKNINVCLTMDKTETDFLKIRCKGQSELVTEITRNLATILCKIIKGKDPEAKCDGIWTSPPENWPSAVPFYSPHNRGKCKQTGSDKELVLTLIQNPKAIIPQKFQSLVATFQQVVNANNSKEVKKHKETLCRIYTIQNNISIIDNALKNMHEHELFTLNIHSILNQWWTTQTLDSQSDEILKNSAMILDNRKAIQIHISKTFSKLIRKKVNNDKDQETLSKEQSKNCQTVEPKTHLSKNKGSSKDEPVTAIDNKIAPSETTGKKRKHPQDEELQSGIKRPTLTADTNYNTKTDEIIETQQSEQPLVGNHEQDNDDSLNNNLVTGFEVEITDLTAEIDARIGCGHSEFVDPDLDLRSAAANSSCKEVCFGFVSAILSAAKIINGVALAKEIKDEVKKEIDEVVASGKRRPKLIVIRVGEDPASKTYVKNKIKACEYTGIESESITLPTTVSEDELLNLINKQNNDESVDGILVQLPVPEHITERKVCNAVIPSKDVDGFNVINVGRLCSDQMTFIPATPAGVMEVIRRTGIETFGKNAVVCGRSKNVGMPCAMLLHADGKYETQAGDATVTLCHRYTPPEQLPVFTKTADILVVACGIPKLITANMVKEGATVIDIGINRIVDEKQEKLS